MDMSITTLTYTTMDSMLKIKYIIFAKINVFFPFLFIHGNIIIIGIQTVIQSISFFIFIPSNLFISSALYVNNITPKMYI